MKRLSKLFFIFCMCIAHQLSSQTTGKISGGVGDKSGKPVEGAIVSLLSAKDSTLVKTAFTEVDGKFEFTELKFDSYLIEMVNMGYEKYLSAPVLLSNANNDVRIQPVTLTESEGKTLKEVTITAQKPFIERKIDRTVMNVDGLISNAGSNALEILEKAPGVLVDQNGGIMLKGKSGVVIFIDDKPTNMSGDALESYLKSLPAGSLYQIEIMTNPPAKYDATGNAGIINIKTRKSKMKGFNGSVSLNYGRGQFDRSMNSLNLNYRYNKFNIFGMVSYSMIKNFNDLDINRIYKNPDLTVKSIFAQNSYILRSGKGGNANLGMDYYLSDNTTLGISLNGLTRRSDQHVDNKSRLLTPDKQLMSTVLADNTEKDKFSTGSINLNYRHQFDSSGREFAMNMDYVGYSTGSDQSFKNYTYDAAGGLLAEDWLTGDLPSTIRIYSFKTDYSHPLKQDSKVEAGAKVSYTQTDNLANYYNTIEGTTTPDYDKSNHFKYDEVISAAYVNYNKTLGFFSVQAGLRGEYTVNNAHQLGNPVKPASEFRNKYFNLFPTFYASYKFDSASVNQLVFSYGKRIDRPYYQDLNPFVTPLDKFTYYSGNPYLKPTFAHVLELSYTYNNMLTAGFSFSRTKDEINETIEIDQNNTYFSRPGNIGRAGFASFSLSGNIPVTKWFSTNVYTEFTHTNYKSKLYTEELNSSGNLWFISVNNRFNLNKGWSFELSGIYRTSMVSSQFLLGEYGFVNIGIQKKILKDKGNLKLSVNDLFYTKVNKGTINNLALTDANYHNVGDSRFVSLTFTYSFGKNLAKERKQGNGAESEQRRVKD